MNSIPALPSNMFTHIFRKDLRLLWPLAIASAAGQLLLALVVFHSDPFSLSEELSAPAALLTLGLAVSMVLLIVLTVQQDAIPGVTQDWLVRPIKRRDLLCAKLLAVALLIHGPIIVVMLLPGLAEGFSPGPLLRATLLSNFEIALVFSLPVMAIAALTRSFGEAVIGALVVFFGLILTRLLILGIFYPFTHSFHFFGSADDAGVGWVWRSLSHVLLLAVFLAVLTLQYFRRTTLESRALFVGGLLLFMFASSLPWKPAFAIQQWLTGNPDASRSVTIAFDPGARAALDAGHVDNLLFKEDAAAKKTDVPRSGGPVIVLPLHVAGVPAGSVLHADRSVVRLIRPDGRVLFRGSAHSFDLRMASGEEPAVGQTIQIPAAVVRKAADQPLRMEVDYSLTLFRSSVLAQLAASEGLTHSPDLGYCATRPSADRTAIEVACRQVGMLPPCVSATLEGKTRNPEKFDCNLTYEPAVMRFSTEPVVQFQIKLPVRDAAGGARFEVDESQLGTARVVLRSYAPVDHFTRRIVIPQFRLDDWRARGG
jgi:hypothetical protein